MRTQSLLLMSLLGLLSACQPEAPAPPDKIVPVVAIPAAVPEQALQPVASEVAPSPAPVEKPAEPAKEKVEPVVKPKEPSIAKPTPVAKPAAVAPAPVVAAPAVAAAKPEVKVATAMSETAALALAKKSGCLICHAVDRKIVGPAWKDVAAKYRGDAGAEVKLMDKIANGGSGVWGAMKMPPQSRVSETDRGSLVRFILSIK